MKTSRTLLPDEPLFSSALQGAFDAAGMDDQVEVLSNQLREREGSKQRGAELMLEQKVGNELGELVGTAGAGSLGDQAWQAGAVEERLGLIEDGTGEPERLRHLSDSDPLDTNAANHFVLDLHEVARVEEFAPEEQGGGHLLGVGVQDALLTKRLALGVKGAGHEDLRASGFV